MRISAWNPQATAGAGNSRLNNGIKTVKKRILLRGFLDPSAARNWFVMFEYL